MIKRGARPRFLGVSNVLAQIVDGGADADLVHCSCDANSIGNLCTGNKARRSTLPKARAFRHPTHPPAFRERNKSSPQHSAPDFFGLKLPEAFISRTRHYIIFDHKPATAGSDAQ